MIGVRLLLAAILIQFLLAGLGVFDSAYFFFWHTSVNGAIVGLLPLVLVAVGWFGRVPRRTLWLTASVFGLVALQSLLLLSLPPGRDRIAARRICSSRRQRLGDLLGGSSTAGKESGTQTEQHDRLRTNPAQPAAWFKNHNAGFFQDCVPQISSAALR